MAVLQTNELLKENLSRKTGLHRLTDEETEAIKNVVLEAALDVIALCDENGIPYMLGGGIGTWRSKAWWIYSVG